MSQPQTTDPIPVPIPIKGLNKRDPLSNMSPEYCPWILNWEPETQYLQVRGGYVQHSDINVGGLTVDYLGAFGGGELFAACHVGTTGYIYDVTASVASLEYTSPGTFGSFTAIGQYGGMLICLGAGGTPSEYACTYDGSSWAAWGFTYDGNSQGGYDFVGYKGRLYLVEDTYLYYSASEAVTGPLSRVNLRTFFNDGADSALLEFVTVLTSPSDIAAEQFLVVGTKYGEVLIYGGDNPAASNWELVARLKLPYIPNQECIIEYGTDIWIVTIAGIVSLRKALQHGTGDFEQITVSSPINPYWAKLCGEATAASNSSYTRTAYWPEKNKIYIYRSRRFLDSDNAVSTSYSTMLVYNGFSGGWTIHKLGFANASAGGGLISFNNALYLRGGNDIIMTYDDTVFKDEDTNTADTFTEYDVELDSAYTNLGGYNKHKTLKGIEAVIKTDFTGAHLGVKAAADFGRKVSSATTPTLQDGRQVAKYNVGVRGSYLQYRFDGTSDDASEDGFELYGVGMVVGE